MSDIEPSGSVAPTSATAAPESGWAAWFSARSGAGAALGSAFNPLVPSVARWRYALGAALVASLVVEVITGIPLMFSYSPSVAAAWGSTYYIQEVVSFGWFLRGMHNFAAHAMIIVAALHLLSAVVAGAYRAPRELNWWLGLVLLGLLVGFTLTGNALVWDQDGFWGWNVETGIAGSAPVIGPSIQRLILGGAELGNATLGRIYALHVAVLPILILVIVRAHIALARRHALNRPEGALGTVEPAWPRQVFANLLVSTVLLGIVSALVVIRGGAWLDAPADPASQYPARPAWFFLWLFELRKNFLGPQEIIATMVIPGALTTVLILLPFFDRVFPRRLAHFLAVGATFAILGGAGFLTVRALQVDAADPHYAKALAEAESARQRALFLAQAGIPPEGGPALLNRDPLYHGKQVLEQKCLGCHAYNQRRVGEIALAAPELQAFGTKAWVRALLENPDAPGFFGPIKSCDSKLAGMSQWKRGKGKSLTADELDQLADFIASMADIPPDLPHPVWEMTDAVQEHPGYLLFADQCADCHLFGEADEANFGPNLYQWGSLQWFRRMLLQPNAPDLYGLVEPSCQMPAFAGQLTENDIVTLYRFLRGDYPKDQPGLGPLEDVAEVVSNKVR